MSARTLADGLRVEQNPVLGRRGPRGAGLLYPATGLGIILVLVGLKGLADFYSEPLIFLDALCGFLFGHVRTNILPRASSAPLRARSASACSLHDPNFGCDLRARPFVISPLKSSVNP